MNRQLAHKDCNEIRSQRRDMLQQWADMVEQWVKGADVVTIGKAKIA